MFVCARMYLSLVIIANSLKLRALKSNTNCLPSHQRTLPKIAPLLFQKDLLAT